MYVIQCTSYTLHSLYYVHINRIVLNRTTIYNRQSLLIIGYLRYTRFDTFQGFSYLKVYLKSNSLGNQSILWSNSTRVNRFLWSYSSIIPRSNLSNLHDGTLHKAQVYPLYSLQRTYHGLSIFDLYASHPVYYIRIHTYLYVTHSNG